MATTQYRHIFGKSSTFLMVMRSQSTASVSMKRHPTLSRQPELKVELITIICANLNRTAPPASLDKAPPGLDVS